jgi:hypothetical protein
LVEKDEFFSCFSIIPPCTQHSETRVLLYVTRAMTHLGL